MHARSDRPRASDLETVICGVLPEVIVLDCDYGAEWPTWIPAAHEPPESGRTEYFPFDTVAGVSPRSPSQLARWEEVAWPPDDESSDIDEGEWRRFITEGRSLAEALQQELGNTVSVQFGFDGA